MVYSEWWSNGTTGDVITMPSGIVLGDLIFFQGNEDSLFIQVDTLGFTDIQRFFYGSFVEIESINFSDLSTFDPRTLTALGYYGTSGDDVLVGEDGIDYTGSGGAGEQRRSQGI